MYSSMISYFTSGELDPKVTLIPSYLDLNMKVAKGLTLGSSLEWDNMQRKLANSSKRINLAKVTGPKGKNVDTGLCRKQLLQ